MKLVIFGLTISSSWGNGHATLWRGLCRALVRRGHRVVFFERDVPYYAHHRDLIELPGVTLCFYQSWSAVLPVAREQLADADAGMVTSYCPDGVAASELVGCSPVRLRTFYDMDTPVTLERVRGGQPVSYIGPRGLRDFDLVLSYTGGKALEELRTLLGAPRVAPLYGSVDPSTHYPVPSVDAYRADLSYLGTYADDRQRMLQALLVETSRRLPRRRFLIGGSLYPESFPWGENICYIPHVPPPEHPSFFCSSTFTLNVTRGAMAEMGYCPSGRLFEAAACAAPLISDCWEGLEQFFSIGAEIAIARTTEEVMAALEMSPDRIARIGRAAQERVLAEHTADQRVRDLERAMDAAGHALAEFGAYRYYPSTAED